MTQLLLIDNQTIIVIIAVVAGVLGVGAMIYGAFRKFTRQTWIGWQVPAVFGLTLLLRFIPAQSNSVMNFAIWAGGFTLAVALVLTIGGIVRFAIYNRKFKAAAGWVAVDRILGLITAPLTLFVLIAVLGSYALSAVEIFSPSALGSVFSMPVWTQFFGKYAVDLFMCAMFVLIMRTGYRMGLFRALYALIMLGLSAGALTGAILFVTKLGFMRKFASIIAGAFGGMNVAVATVLGYGIVILVIFAVFFAVAMILGALLHKLVRLLTSFRVLGVITGIILGIVFTAAFLGVVCGINLGAAYLDQGNLAEVLPESLQGIAAQLESVGKAFASWIQSSPLSAMLYFFNPLRMLVGG